MKKETKPTTPIYLAQVEGAMLLRKKQIYEDWLDLLKKQPHDKVEYKKKKEEILQKIRDLTFDIKGKEAEVYKQNYEVVKLVLMMFCGMDFLTRLYDYAERRFTAVTVGIKRNELLDFVKLCREVANKANEVVQIIDETGKDMMSMAYAGMEDNIGSKLLSDLEKFVYDYGQTPEGRKYFYGYNNIE